ncbi:single-stranded DNA-binding protein [Georgenia faecalis]|uniref:Single-stranded DNA-binding protein n=1 Tax=Georgenia faecalis TaxID=2483799 RepID=A0ABV9DF24_9MICO|nr:single-stranded DNA-binding protein [Georgenia faecalis]
MPNETQVTVRGFVGGPPLVFVTPRGNRLARFRLGTTPRVRDATEGWRDGSTDWYTVKVWNDFADNVSRSLDKGTPVIVRGTLTVETWTTDDGQDRSSPTITADSVGVELNTGTASFTRVVRGARIGGEPPAPRTTDAAQLAPTPWDLPGTAGEDAAAPGASGLPDDPADGAFEPQPDDPAEEVLAEVGGS